MIAFPPPGDSASLHAAASSSNLIDAVTSTTAVLLVCVVAMLVLTFALGLTTPSPSPVRPVAGPLPGPRGFTARLKMLKGAPRSMFNMSRTYGKFFALGSGSDPICVVMDYDRLEEMFATKADSFSDRGGLLDNMMSSIQDRGSIGRNGPAWIEIREFVSQTMKNVDYGRANIARCINIAGPHLKTILDDQMDKPFDPRLSVQLYFMDILHRIIFGVDVNYDYGDKNVVKFVESLYDVVMIALNPPLSALAFPSLVEGCFFSTYRSKFKKAARYVRTHSDETLLRRDGVGASSSIIARFAKYIEGVRAAGRNTASEPNDGWRLAFDFFFAAMGTVPEAILWATLLLATRQDVQEKMRTDIKQLTRSMDKEVTYDDRDRLPYVMATMLEVLRMRPPAPMGVPHYTSEDARVGDYAIPKGAMVLPNIWGMHHDPDIWDRPDEFEPSRFLTEAGELNQEKVKCVIPFSRGARSCPGEQVARMTIFKTLIFLVDNYRISLPVVGPEPTLTDETHSFTMVPDRFKVVFSKLDHTEQV